jgi:hypothetical protein
VTASTVTGGPREGALTPGLLVSLVPPGSVEARVGALQRRIFSETGLPSFLALPPMIPIAFLNAEPTRESFELLGKSPHQRYRIVTAEVEREDEAIFLRVETGGLWKDLRAVVETWKVASSGRQPPGRILFPAREGFFLGCAEGELSASLPPGWHQGFSLPLISFTSATLSLVGVSTVSGKGEWWQDVLWRVIREMPLRARAVGRRPDQEGS